MNHDLPAISPHTRVVATPDTLINVIEGESVLLNLQNETYYGLDAVGTDMWNALTSATSTQSAYENLLNEYEVSPEQLQGDLTEFVGKLSAQGLIQVQATT